MSKDKVVVAMSGGVDSSVARAREAGLIVVPDRCMLKEHQRLGAKKETKL